MLSMHLQRSPNSVTSFLLSYLYIYIYISIHKRWHLSAEWKSGVTSRCGFSFLHAHVNDSWIVFEANKLLRTIDDCNYAMLDGHVMSATVTSPFPEGRWFPVNCGSSSATSVVPSATRPPFLFPFYPQERSWGTRETGLVTIQFW